MSNDDDDNNLESGNSKDFVTKQSYDKVVSQSLLLDQTVRKNTKDKQSLSRVIDVIRQLVMVGTLVVIVLLLITVFVDHPALDFKHKYFAVGGMICICIGFTVSLWLAKGSPSLLLSLVAMGGGVFMFSLGYSVSELRHAVVVFSP